MSIDKELQARSECKCELCATEDNLKVYEVAPARGNGTDDNILICETCYDQIENPDNTDANHWRCLNDSMWSTIPAVQVMAWRMLNRLRGEGWPADLLDMLYLEEDVLEWAKATGEGADDDSPKHKDCNGVELQVGDTVVLTKDLNVKGGGFTAKRGTAVRGISLVHDNAEQIEGKVSGQQIVILTRFVKKSN